MRENKPRLYVSKKKKKNFFSFSFVEKIPFKIPSNARQVEIMTPSTLIVGIYMKEREKKEKEKERKLKKKKKRYEKRKIKESGD